ncbi:MAG: peptide deformylase [Proteobacteria bacterium]|nr:peptide deformylase [Pseudomonadota bacterium]
MIRKIVKYPSPVLLKVAEPIQEVTDEVRVLLDDMAETMYAADGVGLAAPQIGESVRAIVMDVSGGGKTESEALIKMVNPEIVGREGEVEYEEGCLSVPGMLVKIKRAARVKVSYLDENGIREEMDADGLLAIAVQHEIDHLDGVLIIDRVSRLKRDIYLKKRKKEEGHPTAL